MICAPAAHAQVMRRGAVQLLCHRTANRDVPENTLESLALAARIGCNVIEVDIRRTLDGQLVLHHDGYLDRFTGSTGDIETTTLRELDRMDFGAWRGERFRGIHLAHFDDALRLARDLNVNLYLDIKTAGLGPQILAALAREGMTQRVIFGGEWDDIQALYPAANRDLAAHVEPGVTGEQVAKLHHEGKSVVANFLSNGHETDLPAMRAAVAAGMDSLFVEYPRLGAEAAGRPVEATLSRLAAQAGTGPAAQRVAAIRELAQYTGFPLQPHFLHWMMDADDAVSHAAALALVFGRPAVQLSALEPALTALNPAARRSAAWAIGTLAASASTPTACASLLLPLLDDADAGVLQQALLALTWCPDAATTTIPAAKLLPLLSGPVPVVRGLAAVALARYQPEVAAREVPLQLAKEEAEAALYNAEFIKRGRPKLTQAEIDPIIELYRSEMKYVQALSMLPRAAAFHALSGEAFRSVDDYSNVTALVAGYQLWDRLGDDPEPAIRALSASDPTVADRAEWTLAEAGPAVLPAVRSALLTGSGEVRQRLIRILAWQADAAALPMLQRLESTAEPDSELIRWAIAKIESMEVR